MKRFVWNLRFAILLTHHTGLSFRYAWQCASGSDDSFNDGMTPAEAYAEEVSYWSDDQ